MYSKVMCNQINVDVFSKDEGWSIFSYRLRPGYDFYHVSLRHREKVEVLEPAEVRNEVKRICGKNKKYVLNIKIYEYETVYYCI